MYTGTVCPPNNKENNTTTKVQVKIEPEELQIEENINPIEEVVIIINKNAYKNATQSICVSVSFKDIM
ncbi:hypothetical protein FACS189459_2520 [Bacilli bacterium]|nr:hypothetical protein FACS189459_2520 [Bacilli bacterium]